MSFSIHISDWNMDDRVLHFEKKEDALAVLTDGSLTPSEKMSKLYDASPERDGDPRASAMDNADMFLAWPSDCGALGFPGPAEWKRDLADALAELEEGEE